MVGDGRATGRLGMGSVEAGLAAGATDSVGDGPGDDAGAWQPERPATEAAPITTTAAHRPGTWSRSLRAIAVRV
jgi:hypothetical protein